MKVLFIGGTGIISSACTRLAIERGIELYLFNRGNTSSRPAPEGARLINGDIRDPQSARQGSDLLYWPFPRPVIFLAPPTASIQ